ncbi:LuxR C-terminal-related transcriptional regulator [Azospirillum brasilense]|uniref:LuxR C-terminal-related transcriptional regulator n=1 Tax=Azospirillum brasilense TaxID=192 RepID=UPI001177612E|nr:LuxR C-terminal-related transcriptional regulator [Azospirillum brasilense]
MCEQNNQAETVENPFRILTKGEKARITSILIGQALTHERMASKSNAEIARELRVSEYAVKVHKRLMKKLGLLGAIKGNLRPKPIVVPDTTWERLHCAMARAWRFHVNSARGLVSSPYLPSLHAAYDAAASLIEEPSPDLRYVANAADILERLLNLCEE